MGVLVEKPSATRKPDMDHLPGKIGTRFERFWKLYKPVITKYEKDQPVDSRLVKAAHEDAKKGVDTFYRLAERSQKYQSKEMQQALALAWWHMDHMIDVASRFMGADDVKNYKPKPAERGDSGPRVKAYQTLLKDWKFYRKKLDGDYGKETYLAVRAFQKKNRLKVDGKIGKNTAAKIVELAVRDGHNASSIQKLC